MSPTQSLNGGGLYMNIPTYTTPRTDCNDIHIDAKQEANRLTMHAPENYNNVKHNVSLFIKNVYL